MKILQKTMIPKSMRILLQFAFALRYDAMFVPVEEGYMLVQFCHIGASTVS